MLLFEIQQKGFGVQPAGEAGEPSAVADHAMARHDDRQGVAPVRASHSPGEVGVAQLLRLLAIGHRAAVSDGAKRLPGPQLKRRTGRVQWHLEPAALSCEVLPEFVAGLVDELVGGFDRLAESDTVRGVGYMAVSVSQPRWVTAGSLQSDIGISEAAPSEMPIAQ